MSEISFLSCSAVPTALILPNRFSINPTLDYFRALGMKLYWSSLLPAHGRADGKLTFTEKQGLNIEGFRRDG